MMKSISGSIFIGTAISLAILSLAAASAFQYARSLSELNSEAVKTQVKNSLEFEQTLNELSRAAEGQGFNCFFEANSSSYKICYIDYENQRLILSITKERGSS